MIQYAQTHPSIPAPYQESPLSRETIRAMQQIRGDEPCYQTDWRYFCEEQDCQWRPGCRRLVAEWRR
ncbi:MAG: hypothetical protein EPN21_13555 [Methylococcaceae bacterium]|nr:MAG: hypothetical protein EPN21_13555 [Methylococcaceae bacterium]